MLHPVAHFAYILFYNQSLSKNVFHNSKKKIQLTKALQNILSLSFIQVNGKGDSHSSLPIKSYVLVTTPDSIINLNEMKKYP